MINHTILWVLPLARFTSRLTVHTSPSLVETISASVWVHKLTSYRLDCCSFFNNHIIFTWGVGLYLCNIICFWYFCHITVSHTHLHYLLKINTFARYRGRSYGKFWKIKTISVIKIINYTAYIFSMCLMWFLAINVLFT